MKTDPSKHGRGRAFLLSKLLAAALAVGLGVIAPGAWADSIRLNVSLDYGDADGPLVIQGASTSFGFGALIPQLVYTTERFGAFGVGYGYGYGPNQTATLGPVSGTGDLESDVLQFTYSNQFALTDSLSLMLLYENRQYEVKGTLDGSFGSQQAPIAVKSNIDFEEAGVRLAYTWAENLRLFAGVSSLDWRVDSNAFAAVGDSVTAEVDAVGGDTAVQYSVGADTVVWERPLRLEFRAADLEADRTVSKVELRLTTTLLSF